MALTWLATEHSGSERIHKGHHWEVRMDTAEKKKVIYIKRGRDRVREIEGQFIRDKERIQRKAQAIDGSNDPLQKYIL